ncbi:hypothetical protein LP420_22890 [Massilia sp. B-10]|nr:hypothetical protein LP420_22890 [Massilia sp. B-10]
MCSLAGSPQLAWLEARKEAMAYAAACEGAPLRTPERREQAMENGYLINQVHDCIDKASFVAAAEQKARWEAANTPEAKARDAAIRAAHEAENASLQALAAQIQPPVPTSELEETTKRHCPRSLSARKT